MKKVFCDACGYDVNSGLQSFEPLIHIVDHIEGRGAGYVDPHGNSVSGRREHFDLCASCYNAIHFEAYKVFKTIVETVKDKSQ